MGAGPDYKATSWIAIAMFSTVVLLLLAVTIFALLREIA